RTGQPSGISPRKPRHPSRRALNQHNRQSLPPQQKARLFPPSELLPATMSCIVEHIRRTAQSHTAPPSERADHHDTQHQHSNRQHPRQPRRIRQRQHSIPTLEHHTHKPQNHHQRQTHDHHSELQKHHRSHPLARPQSPTPPPHLTHPQTAGPRCGPASPPQPRRTNETTHRARSNYPDSNPNR